MASALDMADADWPARLQPHPSRGAVLAEVHARPFHPVSSPSRLLHFGFLTDQDQTVADRAALSEFCKRHGAPPPVETAKHHYVSLSGVSLRWEQHSEFTTYTWEMAGPADAPFQPPAGRLGHGMASLPQPGPHLVSVDMQVIPAREMAGAVSPFADHALVGSRLLGGRAVVSTDFQVDAHGFVRWLLVDESLAEADRGAVVQRLLEIETYRTLALLGLPYAQTISPRVKEIEDALARIALAMTQAKELSSDHNLLDELTRMAAELEAASATTSYRFAASRAYNGIVAQRLEAISESALDHHPTIASFLSRRMAPAMRTCAAMEDRQAVLSQKLARSADLLRTRVDVAIEQQNRDLLHSVNERTGLQLRLQQTVEGLSIAAISYYVVSLLSYLFKGLKDGGYGPDPSLATAASVPLVLIGVALLVRRIRRSNESAG